MSIINQPPSMLHGLFKGSLWRSPAPEGSAPRAFITFDDGPVPEQTPWVLDVLDKYQLRASFFLVGDNVHKHPDLLSELIKRGHIVGNHTYNHLQLFRSSWQTYADNIRLCDEVCGTPRFFRPPHGQMTPWRAKEIQQTHDLVFWDVIPEDYDRRLSPQKVYDNVRRYVRNGSIIVFHDSVKAGERMRYALQRTLDLLVERGYTFATVDQAFDNQYNKL